MIPLTVQLTKKDCETLLKQVFIANSSIKIITISKTNFIYWPKRHLLEVRLSIDVSDK